METKAAQTLAELFAAKVREYEEGAAVFAVSYARTDSPEAKAKFKDADRMAQMFRELDSTVRKGVHEVEREMRERMRRS